MHFKPGWEERAVGGGLNSDLKAAYTHYTLTNKNLTKNGRAPVIIRLLKPILFTFHIDQMISKYERSFVKELVKVALIL